MESKRITANAKAVGRSVHFIAYVIIVLVVLYSDAMFIALMFNAFPGGFLTVAALGGALATGASIIALVVGKSHWFRPGGQLVWAWVFTGIEVSISILNVIVSVTNAENGTLGYLAPYLIFAPATPVVALVGWLVVLYLDRDREQLHEDMEMDDDVKSSEREHKRQVHEVRMQLKQTLLQQTHEYMKLYIDSPEVQHALREGSHQMMNGVVAEVIQRPLLPKQEAIVVEQGPVYSAMTNTTNKLSPMPERSVVKPAPRPFLANSVAQRKKRLPKFHRKNVERVSLASEGAKIEMK